MGCPICGNDQFRRELTVEDIADVFKRAPGLREILGVMDENRLAKIEEDIKELQAKTNDLSNVTDRIYTNYKCGLL